MRGISHSRLTFNHCKGNVPHESAVHFLPPFLRVADDVRNSRRKRKNARGAPLLRKPCASLTLLLQHFGLEDRFATKPRLKELFSLNHQCKLLQNRPRIVVPLFWEKRHCEAFWQGNLHGTECFAVGIPLDAFRPVIGDCGNGWKLPQPVAETASGHEN